MRRVLLVIVVLLVLAVVGPPAWYAVSGYERPALPAAGRRVVLPDGTGLNVLEQGPRGAPVIVLIHGLPGSAYDWKPLPERLAAAERRVIAYDRKGYGHSDVRGPGEGYTVDENARELLALLEGLDLRDATVVGWSYGGAVIMRAAVVDPSRIARVVLLSSGGPAMDNTEPPLLFRLIFSRPVIAWIRSVPPVSRALTASVSRQAFSEQPMPDWWLPLVRANLSREGTSRAQRAENPAMAQTPLEPEKIQRPVLVIHGTDDRFVPFTVAEDLYQRTQPGSELVRVEGGSHMLPITHTDLLAQRLVIFSAGGSAGGAAGDAS